MDELERRLRAAMTGTSEAAPPNLLAGIRRRHTRYLWRVGATWVVGVAVIAAAIQPASLVLRGLNPPLVVSGAINRGDAGPGGSGPGVPNLGGASPGGGATPSPSSTPAPGTGLRDCQTANNGRLSPTWHAQSLHVGPVWFVYAAINGTWPSNLRLAYGTVPPVTDGKPTSATSVIVAVPNGSTVVVSATPAARQHFRFLTVPGIDPKQFTLRVGRPGVTLAGCPASPIGAGIPESYAAGLTIFWVSYITDLRQCIPLEVRQLAGGKLVHITLSTTGGTCP